MSESKEVEALREKLKASIELFCNCLTSKKAVEAYKIFNSDMNKSEANKQLTAILDTTSKERLPGINLDNILELRERLS